MRRARWACAAAVCAVALAGCSSFEDLKADPAGSINAGATVSALEADVLLGEGSAEDLALSASTTFFDSATIVILASPDLNSQLRAASLAMVLGLPALLTETDGNADAGAVAELERLGATTVLLVGDALVPELSADSQQLRAVTAPDSVDQLQVVVNVDLDEPRTIVPGAEVTALAEATTFTEILDYPDQVDDDGDSDLADLPGLPPYLATDRVDDVMVVATGESDQMVAIGNVRAAGAEVSVTSNGDISTDVDLINGFAAMQPRIVAGVGEVGSLAALSYRADVAATGEFLPTGTQSLLPGNRYLVSPALAAADTDSEVTSAIRATSSRASGVPGSETAIGVAQLPATTASATPGRRGTFSVPTAIEDLRPLVDAAGEADQLVLLRFQPGRESFTEQFEEYADLLALPQVGVVLDATWRFSEGSTPEGASANLGMAEAPDAIEWLADFTRERALPPKLVVIDQAESAEEITSDRAEVAVVVQVDGGAVQAEETDDDGNVTQQEVTAAQVWSSAVTDEGWWGWRQGESPAPLAQLVILDPSPAVITLSE